METPEVVCNAKFCLLQGREGHERGEKISKEEEDINKECWVHYGRSLLLGS